MYGANLQQRVFMNLVILLVPAYMYVYTARFPLGRAAEAHAAAEKGAAGKIPC